MESLNLTENLAGCVQAQVAFNAALQATHNDMHAFAAATRCLKAGCGRELLAAANRGIRYWRRAKW